VLISAVQTAESIAGLPSPYIPIAWELQRYAGGILAIRAVRFQVEAQNLSIFSRNITRGTGLLCFIFD
jgi:hypothetical protein